MRLRLTVDVEVHDPIALMDYANQHADEWGYTENYFTIDHEAGPADKQADDLLQEAIYEVLVMHDHSALIRAEVLELGYYRDVQPSPVPHLYTNTNALKAWIKALVRAAPETPSPGK